MKSDWKLLTLGDVTTWSSGGTPKKDIPEYWNGDIPWISANSMHSTRLGTSDLKITQLGLDAGSRLAASGSVLLLVRGGALHNRIPVGIATRDVAFNQDVKSLKAKHEFITPWYLLFWLMAHERFLLSSVVEYTGIGAGKLDTRRMQSLPFWVPPPNELSAIESFAKSLDDRIVLLRETNATLEAIAQALFKSWFVDFDPVHARARGEQPAGLAPEVAALFPDSFEESELGMVPKGWGVQPIRDVVEGVYDGPHATPPESDVGPVFLGIKNLTGTALDLSDVRHIADEDFIKWTKRVTPKAGDIVFSYEATLGFFALIPDEVKCCLGRRLALIRPMAIDGHGHFWFHQFVAAPFQRHLDKHTIQGATVNRIALKEFPGYPVLNPPSELKQAFEVRAAAIWHKIHLNQKQAQTLANLRDTLLPRLISGQLRLPDAEQQLKDLAV